MEAKGTVASVSETSQAEGRPVLCFRDVDLAYGPKTVLRGVGFDIHAGEFWFFLGPNGEGKTTLLKAIIGEVRPKSGKLWFDNNSTARENLSFIPQRCDLNPTLSTTVREFASLGFTGMRLSCKERAERLSRALERVGLEGMEKKDYWTLSGGQRQRVLVARALVRRPRLLILDEPTKGIDISTEEKFLQFLKNLNREENLTIIFVAHDLNMAARYSTHAAIFSGGSVLAGESAGVLTAENLEKAYGIPMTVRNGVSGSAGIRIAGSSDL